MPVIDSQVHAYDANTPRRPWHSVPNWPDRASGDDMVAAMDKIGIDGAILVSAFTMYRYDAGYALEVRNDFPSRFSVIKPIDPTDPAAAEVIAEWRGTPGTVGVRVMMTKEAGRPPDDAGIGLIVKEAAKHNLPVNVLCWGNLDAGMALVDRHPDTRFVIDHLGITQPHTPPPPPEPWADLPKVLDFAKRENAVIKVSGGVHPIPPALPISGPLGSARPGL